MFLRNFPLATLAGKSTAKVRTNLRPFGYLAFFSYQNRLISAAALRAAVFFFGSLLFSFFPFSASGCQRHQVQRDMLESQMRQQERAMRDMNDELGRSRATTTSLTMENQSLRGVPPVPIAEPAKAPLKAIEFGRGTGGVDEDRVNGDEILQVVIEPKDVDGHTVKAPGTLHLQLYEFQAEGMKTPLSSWDVGPEQLRKAYKSGLLQSGYVLILPWKNAPTREKLRLTALLRIESGQAFEAEKDLKVNIPTGTIATRRDAIQVLPAIPSGMPGILPPPSTGMTPGALPRPFSGPVPSGATMPPPPRTSDSSGSNQTKADQVLPRPIATSDPSTNQAGPGSAKESGSASPSAPESGAKSPPKTVPAVPTKTSANEKNSSDSIPAPSTKPSGSESKPPANANPGAVLLDPVIK